jgi:peroxiredoxin
MEPQTSDPAPPPAPTMGLAIASLVLGILSLTLSFLIVGGLLGLAGLALGAAHLAKKRRPAVMARWGVILSVLGLIASVSFAGLYYSAYRELAAMMESASQSAAPDFSRWEGVEAPDFTVTTLEGQTIRLSGLKGKRVVVDFWATWCPPCVREIPHLVQLFEQTSRDDLVIVGISDEDAGTLKAFVQKKGIHYPVASATNLPSPYSTIQSIPTTFFIDRHGVIQTVAVGYHDYAALKSDALAADFQGDARPAPAAPAALPDADPLLKPTVLWSTNLAGAQALCVGDWAAQGGAAVLVAAGATLHVLNLAGEETSSVPLPARFARMECGRDRSGEPRLLGYSNWGREVTVMGRNGAKLWSVGALFGVDGAHWGDLDGDGSDELVAGMNGMGGLQAWSTDGKQLWSASLANVWNQAVVSATNDLPARVLATEAGGSVKVFDAQGKLLKTLRPEGGYYAQMAACRRADHSIQIVGINKDTTSAFDEDGTVQWTTSAARDNGGWRSSSFAAGDLNGDGDPDWVFVDGSGNLLIAAAAGRKLSSVPHGASMTAFAIVPRPGRGGILVTLDGGTVRAYTFNP